MKNFKSFKDVVNKTVQERRARNINNSCKYGIDILDNYLGGILENELVVIGASTGVGKAQRLTDKVLTPNGWDIMGNIKPGSYVIGADGRKKLVIAEPYKGKQKVYNITTDDGRSCTAGEHHEFQVNWRVGSNHKSGRLEVKDLIKGIRMYGLSFSIDLVKPINFNNRELKLDPYVMGALLGDGYLGKGIRITSNDIEIIDKIKSRLPVKDKISEYNYKNRANDYGIITKIRNQDKSETYKILDSYGLVGKKSNNKFIPEDYLFSGLKDRIELLRGLMDTDGYVVKNRKRISTRYGYTTISKELAYNIRELLMGLGAKVSLNVGNAKINGEIKSKKYILSFSLDKDINAFYLKRKSEKVFANKPNLRHFIKSIEYIGEYETKCITVEGGLYITQDYIVTHNTEIAIQIALKNASIGKRVGLFSLEGDIGEIAYRYLQREINKKLDGKYIKGPKYRFNLQDVTKQENEAIKEIPKSISDNLYVFDKEFIPNKKELLELISNIRKEVDIFIIDHLHYLDLGVNEYSGLTDIVRSIKEMTEIIRKPVVLISHLSRKYNGDRLPNNGDLHGSSNIEKNANTIILITPGDNNEVYDDEEKNYLRSTQLIVSKNRTGMPVPAIFDTTFDLNLKEYKTGKKYNSLSVNDKNRVTIKDKIF